VWRVTFATDDINKDGRVEILTTWYTNADLRWGEFLWMFSWDGAMGIIVNQIDRFGESAIFGSSFKLVDHDSSQIKDIVATSASSDASITKFFRWDGRRYVWDRETRRPFDDQGDH
jgi:hypothetical protein